MTDGFDLRHLPPGFYDDPFPVYRALREQTPARRMPDDSVFLTRYADISAVYHDAETFSSDKKREFAPKYGADSRLFRHHTTSLVFNDAPYHTRVRRPILGALIPKALHRLEPKLETLVARLLDHAEANGRLEAIGEFAGAIPVEVIGDLLDIPDEDRAPLRDWSLAILGALEEMELAENCVFLLNAGHETTTNLIGNAIELLARFPGERARLIAQPDLLRYAIEEVLRYESSNQLGNRVTTRETKIGDETLAAGTFVTLCIGAANRDPEAFDDPERLTYRAIPTGTSPSRRGRTNARACIWRGWKRASRSARS